jgi:CBS domain containing-hemolysin-like protein
MLSGAQLGITVTTLIVGFIAEPAIASVIEPLLDAVGVPESMRLMRSEQNNYPGSLLVPD